MSTSIDRPYVGAGLLILRDGKILIGKRKNSNGAGEYGAPGGHVEWMESAKNCLLREVEEECGPVRVDNIRFLCVSCGTTYNNKHYVTLMFAADWVSGEAELREPDRCEGWEWHPLDQLPEPLFQMTQHGIEAYKTGRNFFDT